MLNEIMQREELKERRLVDLYEEGILELGDEIPYKPEEMYYKSPICKNGMGNQEFYTKDVDVIWRTFGKEKIGGEECLKLITKDPIFEFALGGIRGCVYGIEELNNISQIFATGKGALKGRSTTIEDISQVLDVVIDKETGRVYQRGNPQKTLANSFWNFSRKKCENIRMSFELEKMLIDSNINELRDTVYYYNVDYFIEGKEREQEIILGRKDNFWLASSGMKKRRWGTNPYSVLSYIDFGIGVCGYGCVAFSYLYSSISSIDDISYPKSYKVRPIVYLKPDITLKDFEKKN